MAITFASLRTSPTLAQVKATIISTANVLGLSPQNWAEGGFSRTLVALVAQLHKASGDVVTIIAESGFLETAAGDWLTLLAYSVFRVTRIEATYAEAAGAVTLTNSGGGLYVFEAGDVIVAHSGTNKTYRNTSGGTLSPLSTVTLDMRAEEAGSASNAAIGDATVLVTGYLGVTATNTVALVGLDAESDASLRERCRDSLSLLALGGIKRAYSYVARSAVDGAGVSRGITRVTVMPATGDGTVDVYIAGVSGDAPGGVVTAIQGEFDEKVTPYGFDATAISATPLSVSAPMTVWVPAALGLAEIDVQTAVNEALEAYVNAIPIGGVVISPAAGKVYWRALLATAAGAVPGALKIVLGAETDTTVADAEAPVWGGSTGDVTVVQVTS